MNKNTIGIERERFIINKNQEIVCEIARFLPIVHQIAIKNGIDINHFTYELSANQVEDRTSICNSLKELRESLLENDDILNRAAKLLDLSFEFSEYVDIKRFKDLIVNPFSERHQIIWKNLPQELRNAASQVTAIHVHFGVNEEEAVSCLNINKEAIEYLINLGNHSNFKRINTYKIMSRDRCYPPKFDNFDEIIKYINICGGEKNVYDMIRYKPSTKTIELRMFGSISNIDEILGYVEESKKVLKLGR